MEDRDYEFRDDEAPEEIEYQDDYYEEYEDGFDPMDYEIAEQDFQPTEDEMPETLLEHELRMFLNFLLSNR